MAVLAVVFISGCKQNEGTPEDNAVVEEPEEEPEDEAERRLFGYSCPDLENPFYQVLKDSIGTALEEQGSAILVRDAQQDADMQAAQIQEMIDAEVDMVFLCPVDAERITECWRSITHNSGSAHRCTYQPHYTYNINIPVRHNDPESIDNIRGALHYLAKEEQKDGLCAYGCNEVPERPAAGRPRKPHF